MLKKTLLFTAATLGFSGAALAHPPQWAPAHGYRMHEYRGHEYRGHEYREHEYYRPYVVAPGPVYVVPAPRVVYAAPPAPVYYPAPAAVPVYPAPGVSIRFNLPL